jgi:S1-C subfamily serine protease
MDDSPAVQLVSNHQSAAVTWYRADASIGKLVTFANRNPASVAAWSHRRYRAASEDIVSQFLTRAGSYLARGRHTRNSVAATSYGSAWGVSADGYLVTNHHVVQFLDDAFWVAEATGGSSSRASAAQTVAASLEKQLTSIRWGRRPLTLSSRDVAALQQLAGRWIATTSSVSERAQTIDIGGGQNVNLSNRGMAARVITTSRSTWPDADVAILKVNAANLPVVPLGDDTTIQTADTVYALGYPYDASFTSGTAPSSTVTATFSSGQVTNRLQTPGGFSAIEDSAPINHGSSGGPLLNSSGQVIGMVTAVDTSTDTATEINGGKFFYAIPVSVVRTYLRAAGITQRIPRDEPVWDQAMSLMQHSHYKAALADLREVEADGYSTPYIMMHTQMIKAAIRNGENKPLPHAGPSVPVLPLAAAAVLLCAGSGITLALIRWRRRRGSRQAPMASGLPAWSPAPFEQYPASPVTASYPEAPPASRTG